MRIDISGIATGIKAEKMGIKSLPTLSPAVRSAQQSVKSVLLKREKLPIETVAKNVTSEIIEDDLEVPTFLRRKKQDGK